jgi:hypothetical protein
VSARTEYELEHIEPGPFEKLAIDVLTRNGYRDIDPQGTRGPDGGKDGLLLDGPDGENVIAHFSVNQNWKSKLFDDLDKAVDHDREYDKVVFVTNRDITGTAKTDVPEDVEDEYGWVLDLWGQQKLRRELDNHHQDLRKKYLRIAPDEGPEEKAQRLIDDRLRKIRRRSPELPQPIEQGGVAVLHVIPHESVITDNEFEVDELPKPGVLGRWGGKGDEKTLDGRVSYQPGQSLDGPMDLQNSYTYVDCGGWVEVLNTFVFKEEEQLIGSKRFEKETAKGYVAALDAFRELGIDPPVEVCLSLLGVRGYSFAVSNRLEARIIRGGERVIRQDDIEGKLVQVDDFDAKPGEALKSSFDRLWRAARWDNGSPYYSDGEWLFEAVDPR